MDVIELITGHEGDRGYPYCDKCGGRIARSGTGWFCGCLAKGVAPGNLTIGRGHNLDAGEVPGSARLLLLQLDLADTVADLKSFPWFGTLDDVRKAALVDLHFNVGATKFREFVRMIAALARGDWAHAAVEMLRSKWAQQTGERAAHDAFLLRWGRWDFPP